LIEGECNCGSVAFNVQASISDVYICHCSICRMSTGGGGIAVAMADNDKFDWTRGREHITRWSKPGHDWHTYFCSICGSSLPGENDPESMYLPVGTLTEGHENLKVAHHIYVNSKAPWEEIGESGKQHPEGFGR
jgi:hypothetical protein